VALADRAGRATADSGAGVGGAVRGHVLLLLSREYFALLRPLLESGTTSVQQSKRGVREWDRSLVSLSGGSPASSPSRLPCRLRSGVSVSVPFQGLHCCVALHDSRVKKNVWRTTTVAINHSPLDRKISTADYVVKFFLVKIIVALFVVIWQNLSNYGLTRFKRFVSTFIDKPCN
jgi:hypothetical protein